MKWNIRNKISGLILLAVFSFIVLGTWSYITISRFMDSVENTALTHEILETNDLLLSYLADAQRGERGYVITGEKKFLEPYEVSKINVVKALDRLNEMVSVNYQEDRLLEYKQMIDENYRVLEEVIDVRTTQGFEAAQKIISSDIGKSMMDDFTKLATEFNKHELDILDERNAVMVSNANTTNYIIIFGSILAALLLGIIGYFLIINITKPLYNVTDIASKISSGDLSVNLNKYDRKDEIGLLYSAFAQMIQNLRMSIEEITEGVNLLGSSSSEILAATTQVAAGISETSTAISETTTTVEEVRQASQLSNDKATNVSEKAQQNALASKSGEESVQNTIKVVNQVQKQMEEIAATVVRLSEQSQEIGGIIATVNDVADQSNLLAVNASIEAAKAGEHGKGFTVVAEEIKNLAQLSKEATTQVRSILFDVQKATTDAVMATEQGSKSVNEVVDQAALAGDAIRVLTRSVNESIQAASQIVASSQQQNVGMDQVGLAINNINQAGAENAASMKQAEIAAKDLADLGNKLKQFVNQYKL